MATSATVYNSAKKKLMQGSFVLDTDTVKVALCTSSYSPNIDSNTFFSDITNEITGTGYTAGGATLANKSVTQDNTNDLAYFDADDTTWAASTLTARFAVIYKSTGTASTSPVLFYIDFGADRITLNETFYIQWASTGLLKLS